MLTKKIIILTKINLASDWRGMAGAFFPWQGNSNSPYRMFSAEPSPSLAAGVLLSSDLSDAVSRELLLLLHLPDVPSKLITGAAGAQPCLHSYYMSSYHNVHCPHWVGIIPFYGPADSALFQRVGLPFSAHRTLPSTTTQDLHSVYSADVGYRIISHQNRGPTWQQLQAW